MIKAQFILASLLKDTTLKTFDDAREMDQEDLMQVHNIDKDTARELSNAIYNEANDIPIMTVNLTHAQLNRVTTWLEEYKDLINKSADDQHDLDIVNDMNDIIAQLL